MIPQHWNPQRALPRAVSLALVASALVTACAVNSPGQAPVAPVSVRVAPAQTANVSGKIAYSGNVASQATVNLIPKSSGQIVDLKVDVGTTVKKGDVIAQLDHAVQDAQVAQAQAALSAAQTKLATIQAGPRAELVAQAQANLAAAQESLKVMQQGGRTENVQAAQGNLSAALAHLQALQVGRDDAVAQAKANLAAAQAHLQDLKNGATPDAIKAAQLAVSQAKNAAYAADVSKDAACNPSYPKASCDAGQAAAFAAHTGVDVAQARLDGLLAGATKEQIAGAQAAVDAAQAQLQLVEHPGSANDLAAATAAVQVAQAQVKLAESPYTSADLAKAQAAVDVAQQQLKLTQTPFTKQDEDAAKAGVQQAQAALALAQVGLDQTTVVAPIDGIVSQKLQNVGALASPATPIVVLVAPSVEVDVAVDATSASSLQNGQAAVITSDALPGKSIDGSVTNIAPTVDAKTHTVQVKVTPKVADSGLKDGMLVQVTLVSATHNNAVVVPASAIVQRNGEATVYVVSGDQAKPVTVKTGLTDGTNTEITSGIQAGQQIVTSGQNQLTAAQTVSVLK